jgi:hypothetical protein
MEAKILGKLKREKMREKEKEKAKQRELEGKGMGKECVNFLSFTHSFHLRIKMHELLISCKCSLESCILFSSGHAVVDHLVCFLSFSCSL